MGISKEDREAYVKAKLAEKSKKKGKDSLPQVIRKPYDPENALLSRDEYIAKKRKAKEEAVAIKEFVSKKGEPDAEEKTEIPEVKKGRPKKVV